MNLILCRLEVPKSAGIIGYFKGFCNIANLAAGGGSQRSYIPQHGALPLKNQYPIQAE